MKRQDGFLGAWQIVVLTVVVALLFAGQAFGADQRRKIEPVASMGHTDSVYAVAF
jgi:hypothetical protein